jgi:hypothetical protein
MDDSDNFDKIYNIGVGIGASLAGLAFLLVVINVGREANSTIVQITVTIASTLFTLWMGSRFVTAVIKSTNERLFALERRFANELAKLNKRVPILIGAAILWSNAILIIANNSFGNDTPQTVIVTLMLTAVFYFANTLMQSEKRSIRYAGRGFYTLTIVSLVLIILNYYKWDMSAITHWYFELNLYLQIGYIITIITLLALPFIAQHSAED